MKQKMPDCRAFYGLLSKQIKQHITSIAQNIITKKMINVSKHQKNTSQIKLTVKFEKTFTVPVMFNESQPKPLFSEFLRRHTNVFREHP
jgi:hypothetical protein